MSRDLVVFTVAIGQSARHAADAVQTATRETTGLQLVTQQTHTRRGDRRVAIEFRTGESPVQHPLSFHGHRAHRHHSRVNGRGALAVGFAEQFVGSGPMSHYSHVEAIEQRTREAAPVLGERRFVALTGARRTTTARTRIGRAHQGEPSRQHGRRVRSTQPHHTFFERLAQRVEGRRCELTQFVEEQDSTVRQAHLPGSQRRTPPADHGHQTHRVMRHPNGRHSDQSRAWQGFAGRRANHRGFERCIGIETGQETGKALRQHRLARSRRTHQQQVMSARRGEFETESRRGLSAHVDEIGNRRVDDVTARVGRFGPRQFTGEMFHETAQIVSHARVTWFDEATLLEVVGGDHHDVIAQTRRHRRHTGHRSQTPVERQFGEKGVISQRPNRRGLDLAVGHQNGEGDGHVETAAHFARGGRGQVDGDAPTRPSESARHDRGAHPITSFTAHVVGASEDRKTGQTGGDVAFDDDRGPMGSDHTGGSDVGDHVPHVGPTPLHVEIAAETDTNIDAEIDGDPRCSGEDS